MDHIVEFTVRAGFRDQSAPIFRPEVMPRERLVTPFNGPKV
jgi:hypothetical protein